MKRLICATVACLMLGGTVVWASATQGKSKKHNAQSGEKGKAPDAAVSVQVVFASSEVVVLRNHYAPRQGGRRSSSLSPLMSSVSCLACRTAAGAA